MEISWYGLSCFRLTERGSASVVTDPYPDDYGYIFPRPRADIIAVSCDGPTRNAVQAPRGPARILDGPGEYEIGSVFVTGVTLIKNQRKKTALKRNVIFVFDFAGITVCHLGALNHVPSQSQIEALGAVNVLLTPIGGKELISSAQASEVISMLEPNLVIPMQYHAPPGKLRLPRISNFLKEMGTNKVESVESLKVVRSSLPEETQVVLLTLRQ